MNEHKHSELFIVDHETGEVINNNNGIEIQYTKNYGCGIDCAAKFIQISVLVKQEDKVIEYREAFDTDWNSVVKARDWVISILKTCARPAVEVTDDLHYCLESTSVYHIVVIKAWKGRPSIINPSIAGATKKKTDILDARMLAIQDLTCIWRESYIPSAEVDELKLLLAERENCTTLATRASLRINNFLLKFGYTLSRDGSVTGDKVIRENIEKLISDNPVGIDNICPNGLPDEVKRIIRQEYEEYDRYRKMVTEYDNRILRKIHSMEWETVSGKISGKEMMRILCSAPGVGKQTAIIWLARIITPRRFPNEKALAAYCGLDPSLKVSAGKVTSTVKRGGCKDIHSALCQAASRLMSRHNEPFGQWGYNIATQSGRWKKGVAAVARKLAVAMYYMSFRGEEFSYEKYKMMTEPNVIDIPVEKLSEIDPAFKRYVRHLISNEIHTTKEMVHSFYLCELVNIKGLGKKFFGLLKTFINEQNRYRTLLEGS